MSRLAVVFVLAAGCAEVPAVPFSALPPEEESPDPLSIRIEAWLRERNQESWQGLRLTQSTPAFAGLEALDRAPTLALLMRMGFDARYVFREETVKGDVSDKALRILAIRALGKLGDDSTRKALRARLNELEPAISDATLVSIYHLGDPGLLRERLLELEVEAARASDSGFFPKELVCRALFLEAVLMSQVDHVDEAEGVYERIIAVSKQRGNGGRNSYVALAYYNLACIHAARGGKERALDLLESSVSAGLQDRRWLLCDRELDPLRGEDRFRRLLDPESRSR